MDSSGLREGTSVGHETKESQQYTLSYEHCSHQPRAVLPGGREQGALQWNLLSHEEEVLKELLRQHAGTNCGQWIRQFNINKISLLNVRNQ